MRLQSLRHLVDVTRAAARCDRIIVLGSASLLATFPSLGDPGQPVETSADADLLVEPYDEDVAALLDEAIGEDRRFHARFGYHADILRAAILEQLPRGWEERLVPLEGCPDVFCIEPHDLAVAKLQAGRTKDVELLVALLQSGMLSPATIHTRLRETSLREHAIVTTHKLFTEVIAQANL